VIGSAAPTQEGAVARRRVPPAIPVAIGLSWALAVVAQVSGTEALLGHDALIHHRTMPLVAALAIFLLAWQAMIVSMMLPSSLPMIRMFGGAAAGQDRPGHAMVAFLGGYAVVWTAFGAAAFLGDAALHYTADRTPWLLAHPQVIGASVLALAGAFQFSSLKDRCLSECRQPGPFLMSRYGRGAGAAFRLGSAHGRFCLGCCWALMLVMFAVGVAHLWWMAALTAVMVFEKRARHGATAVPWIGVILLALSASVLLQYPAWLPRLLAH
jgi:predicted metal-binding membrane protein